MDLLAPGAGEDLDACLSDYARSGYARLGPVASQAALAAMRARADDLMLGRVAHEELFFQADAESGAYEDLPYGEGWVGPSLRYRKVEKLEKDPVFRAFIGNALFERVARRFVPASSAVTLYRAVLFTKPARGGTRLPFHQDGGSFWGLDREPALQIWTALDDAPLGSGCLEVLPGSHVAGLATPLGGVIPREKLGARDLGRERVLLPARAGESILLHNHLWHGSGTNSTGAPRRALTVCFLHGETRCLRRRKAPRIFPSVFPARS